MESDEYEEQRQLVTILNKKWPYQGNDTSFVQIGHNDEANEEKDNDRFLCVLGGSGIGETDFKQIDCMINDDGIENNVRVSGFHFNKLLNYKNAHLNRLRNARNGSGILSFFINNTDNEISSKNDKIGGKDSYIIILSKYDGYSCYNCDKDEWIIKNSDKIIPQTHYPRGLLLLNHSLDNVPMYFL